MRSRWPARAHPNYLPFVTGSSRVLLRSVVGEVGVEPTRRLRGTTGKTPRARHTCLTGGTVQVRSDTVLQEVAVSSVSGLLPSYSRHLLAYRSRATHKTYTAAVRSLLRWAGDGFQIDDVTRAVMREFIAARASEVSATTVNIEFRALRQFFKWAVDEGEIASSPMDRLPYPRTPSMPPNVFTHREISALLRACAGRRYVDLRDLAMVRLLIDTGMRRSELAYLLVEDVMLDEGYVRVVQRDNAGRGPSHDPGAPVRVGGSLRRNPRRNRRGPHVREPGLRPARPPPRPGPR